MIYYTVTQPDIPPGWLAVVKRQCGVADAENGWDAELCSHLETAVEAVQTDANRQLLTATVVAKMDCFPTGRVIEIPYGPLASVTSITYLDNDGASQTLATSVYDVDTARNAGEIFLKYNQSWPATRSIQNAITITYVAGVAMASVPAQALHAIKLLVSHAFENREPILIGKTSSEIEQGYRVSINRLRFGEGVI